MGLNIKKLSGFSDALPLIVSHRHITPFSSSYGDITSVSDFSERDSGSSTDKIPASDIKSLTALEISSVLSLSPHPTKTTPTTNKAKNIFTILLIRFLSVFKMVSVSIVLPLFVAVKLLLCNILKSLIRVVRNLKIVLIIKKYFLKQTKTADLRYPPVRGCEKIPLEQISNVRTSAASIPILVPILKLLTFLTDKNTAKSHISICLCAKWHGFSTPQAKSRLRFGITKIVFF